MRILAVLLFVLLAAAAIVFFLAGRAEPPGIVIEQPGALVGLEAVLDLTVRAPGGQLDSLEVTLEQQGKEIPVFSLQSPGDAEVRQAAEDKLHIRKPFGKRNVPELQAGPARVVATASRPVLFGLRKTTGTATRDIEVRLTPPRMSVVSSHHHVIHGGAEMVVYTVSPAEAESGVRVGDVTYRGYPASGAGVPGEAGLRVAFFALLHDQDLNTPIQLYARDEAGNQSSASFDFRVFPRRFRQGRINLDDGFLDRVVPAIFEQTPDLGAPSGDRLSDFLTVNSRLRELNAETIAGLADRTASEMLWQGAFRPLTNASIESGFADRRTYYYQGREVDRQIHLGFDLAVTQRIPVLAANSGKVLLAEYLGIYGNTVVIDHGMGVQSLYAHLSSIDVEPGESVQKDQQIGRSGMTGLAGGDHLHFTVLAGGYPVNPVEWWDPHWIEDRIARKLREAAGG